MGVTTPATKLEAATATHALNGFIGTRQLQALDQLCRGEERQFFFDMLKGLAQRVCAMPTVYEQDGKGEHAMVYLHYFVGNQDWYIMEKDAEPIQHQAFGLADLSYGGELGYISIHELITYNIELDLYWEPKTLEAVKTK
ncbi:MAG: hypothetical protein Q7U76_13015 [Nitrospirota bacterium]|nr:hypothetical protein [Nitrospirota bacterium]